MRNIIFDFNGTMFQDTDKNIKAWSEFLRRHCGRYPTMEEFTKYINGSPNPTIICHFLGNMPLEETWKYAEEKEEIYRELCLADRERLVLTEGLETFLDWLCRHEVPINIATGADPGNLAFYRKHLGLDRWFDPEKIVVSDGTFPGKPAPDIYRIAAERIGVDLAETIVIEDAMLGVRSAKAAGADDIVGLCAIEESGYLRTMPEVGTVIENFHDFHKWLEPLWHGEYPRD